MANDWQKFHWDLEESLDATHPALAPFVFRTAEPNELAVVLKVVSSALLMERAWTAKGAPFTQDLEERCEKAFDAKPPACVVVQHGSRVIGASVLDAGAEAEFHLVTGPCILHEYRCRGLGAALLHQSLVRLHADGLRVARALARVNSTAARFIYPKFGGVAEPLEVPRLAA
jgi:ribosomal protein S18 acetylase RimI-like enzyme